MKKYIIFATLALASVLFAFAGDWTFWGNFNKINCIVEHDGLLWIGTDGGVISYNVSTGDHRNYSTIEGLGGLSITALCADDDGFLWYAASNGYIGALNKYNFRSVNSLAVESYIINDMCFFDGSLWLSTSKGIVRALPVANSFAIAQFADFFENFASLPAQSAIFDVAFLRDTIFAATTSGLICAPLASNLTNPASWNVISMPDGRPVARVEAFAETLWVLPENSTTSHKVIYFFADGMLVEKNMPLNFNASTCYNVIAAQGMWFFTSSGVRCYNNSTATLIAPVVNVPQNICHCAQSTGTQIFFGTEYGLGVFDSARVAIDVFGFNTYFGTGISDISFVESTACVCVLNKSASLLTGDNWQTYDYFSLLPKIPSTMVSAARSIFGSCRSCVRTPDGTVWIGSYGAGILKIFSDTTFEIWDTTNSSLATSVPNTHYPIANRLRVDGMGNLWVVSYLSNDNAPIKCWKSSQLNNPRGALAFSITSHNLPSTSVRAFCCDNQKIVAGTTSGGWIFFHNGTLDDTRDDRIVVLRGVLPNDEVNAVAIAPDGKIWFGTGNGLAYWDPGDFVVPMPMPDELSATITSICADSTGNIWVATLDGATVYMPAGYYSTFKSAFSDDAMPSDRTPLISDAIGTISGSMLGGVFTDGVSGNIWFGFNEGAVVLHSPYSLETSVNTPIIYPNPAIVSQGRVPTVFIGNVSGDAILKIYDAAGNFIRELDAFWKGHDGYFRWDLKNSSGETVAGGVYVIVAESAAGVKLGKLFIAR